MKTTDRIYSINSLYSIDLFLMSIYCSVRKINVAGEKNTVMSRFMNFSSFRILGKMATSVLAWGRWPWSCLSPMSEFVNGSKILPDSFA